MGEPDFADLLSSIFKEQLLFRVNFTSNPFLFRATEGIFVTVTILGFTFSYNAASFTLLLGYTVFE